MIAEYNSSIDNDVREYWEANGHLFPDNGKGYQENPAWKMAQTLTEMPPYMPYNSEKKYFIWD